jgi:hypothetical protein
MPTRRRSPSPLEEEFYEAGMGFQDDDEHDDGFEFPTRSPTPEPASVRPPPQRRLRRAEGGGASRQLPVRPLVQPPPRIHRPVTATATGLTTTTTDAAGLATTRSRGLVQPAARRALGLPLSRAVLFRSPRVTVTAAAAPLVVTGFPRGVPLACTLSERAFKRKYCLRVDELEGSSALAITWRCMVQYLTEPVFFQREHRPVGERTVVDYSKSLRDLLGFVREHHREEWAKHGGASALPLLNGNLISSWVAFKTRQRTHEHALRQSLSRLG